VREVVVTGVGAVTPLGVGARTLHERWIAGSSGLENGEGACTAFDPTDVLSRKEARRADRFTQLAIASADEAVRDAGWDGELPYDPARIGSVIGTGIGGIGTIEDNHDSLRDEGARAISPLAVPLMMGNAGTATPLNDRAETAALKLALGEAVRSIPVSSTKSATGHSLGAAGAVEAVATLLALRDRIAPPTLGWEEAEDGLDLDYVPNTARPLVGDRPAIGLSNSFGFGGHNATLILEALPA
jgi:3-oxoacyl-(acyl-carrier-protein) synthase